MYSIELGKSRVDDLEYHADVDFLTSSMVKTFATDKLLFKHEYVDLMPDPLEDDRPNASLELGDLVHRMLYEDIDSAEFTANGKSWVVFDGVRRGKKWEEFCDEHEGKLKVTLNTYEKAKAIARATRENVVVKALTATDQEVERELCYAWQETVFETDTTPETQMLCKCKPDVYVPTYKTILDYKTIGMFSERLIRNKICELKYHLQAAHYIEGIAAVTDRPIVDFDFIFLFVEAKAPYRTAAVRLHTDDLARAFGTRRETLKEIVQARASNDYSTDYSKQITTIQLPVYV